MFQNLKYLDLPSKTVKKLWDYFHWCMNMWRHRTFINCINCIAQIGITKSDFSLKIKLYIYALAEKNNVPEDCRRQNTSTLIWNSIKVILKLSWQYHIKVIWNKLVHGETCKIYKITETVDPTLLIEIFNYL